MRPADLTTCFVCGGPVCHGSTYRHAPTGIRFSVCWTHDDKEGEHLVAAMLMVPPESALVACDPTGRKCEP